MKRDYKPGIWSLVILGIFLASNCAKTEIAQFMAESQTDMARPTPKTKLTETQAVEFAERFIARNGYTDQPPDKENLARESIEWESNVDEMLRMRHDTLESKAFGISRNRKGGSAGWTVVFRPKHPDKQRPSKNGRAVTMNLDGSDARVEHVDFILAKVEKKL